MKKLLTVIIPAAGMGKRMGLGKNKAFLRISGIPLLVLCLQMLEDIQMVRRAVILVGSSELEEAETMLKEYRSQFFPGLDWMVAAGGKERQDSVANGLALIPENEGFVAVHDGARPFAGREVFLRTLEKAKEYGAAIAAVSLKDTVKFRDEKGMVTSTPDRSSLCAVQTPQIFEIGILRKAYAFLKQHPFPVTDDASLAEAIGHPVAIAEGSYENIKITTPEDLLLAERIMAKRNK